MNLLAPPLTVREVAGFLGTSADVVRSLLNRHKLKGKKVGGQWRILREDLAEYLVAKIEEK